MSTTVSYKCPSCGGPLKYGTGKAEIQCEYCDSIFTMEALQQYYAAKEEAAGKERQKQEEKWENTSNEWSEEESAIMRAFTCSSCGSEVMCDNNTMATECCYCGNPTMLPSRFQGMLKPKYVLPFKKTKQEAIAALKKFYKGKELLPDAFVANNRVERVQGLYVPFWLYNAYAKGMLNFATTKKYQEPTSGGHYDVTEYYKVNISTDGDFEKVPCDGSVKMQDDYMDSVEPYDYSEMVPFNSGYLAGYLADRFDVSVEENQKRANLRIDNTLINHACSELNKDYSTISLEEQEIERDFKETEYCMLPVWILTTRYEEKPYTFMMNGQTGKFIGILPIDEGKAQKMFWSSLRSTAMVGGGLGLLVLGAMYIL